MRLGDRRTRWLYVALVAATFVALVVGAVLWRLPALLGLLAAVAAVPPVSRIRRGAAGPELIAVLGETGRLQLAFAALTTIGLVISRQHCEVRGAVAGARSVDHGEQAYGSWYGRML